MEIPRLKAVSCFLRFEQRKGKKKKLTKPKGGVEGGGGGNNTSRWLHTRITN